MATGRPPCSQLTQATGASTRPRQTRTSHTRIVVWTALTWQKWTYSLTPFCRVCGGVGFRFRCDQVSPIGGWWCYGRAFGGERWFGWIAGGGGRGLFFFESKGRGLISDMFLALVLHDARAEWFHGVRGRGVGGSPPVAFAFCSENVIRKVVAGRRLLEEGVSGQTVRGTLLCYRCPVAVASLAWRMPWSAFLCFSGGGRLGCGSKRRSEQVGVGRHAGCCWPRLRGIGGRLVGKQQIGSRPLCLRWWPPIVALAFA